MRASTIYTILAAALFLITPAANILGWAWQEAAQWTVIAMLCANVAGMQESSNDDR